MWNPPSFAQLQVELTESSLPSVLARRNPGCGLPGNRTVINGFAAFPGRSRSAGRAGQDRGEGSTGDANSLPITASDRPPGTDVAVWMRFV